MDMDSLRCFDSAATTLNFRAAAERVHLSPAAFSDRLRRLEEHFEAPLFRRTTRRVGRSGAGRVLLPLARELIAGADRMRDALHAPRQRGLYELSIGTRYEL